MYEIFITQSIQINIHALYISILCFNISEGLGGKGNWVYYPVVLQECAAYPLATVHWHLASVEGFQSQGKICAVKICKCWKPNQGGRAIMWSWKPNWGGRAVNN